ncbi:ras-related protein Rab-20 isoform X5 [Camelus ferus]|uniref:Ras-related protein Rab-20 isoform X5 n=1 Tax=Camelus ferus TaxID=419612 RepID=A0A8B8UE05_CAMFR|nr:ras-related protein Rab-20 isoform X5 [Camelus ferus]
MRKPDGKIVLLGDMNVGKTSLLQRYMERRFTDTVSTVGGAFYLKQWRSYNISIWDTAELRGALMPGIKPLSSAVSFPRAGAVPRPGLHVLPGGGRRHPHLRREPHPEPAGAGGQVPGPDGHGQGRLPLRHCGEQGGPERGRARGEPAGGRGRPRAGRQWLRSPQAAQAGAAGGRGGPLQEDHQVQDAGREGRASCGADVL